MKPRPQRGDRLLQIMQRTCNEVLDNPKTPEVQRQVCREWLDALHDPALLPVPLHYDSLARLLTGDFSEWRNKVARELAKMEAEQLDLKS